eukprot:GCRY01003761.1.p1 GENE.GCRY01003761.1~~GCRY01003761.1.p1  ORF type:complete len:409 (-),score=112.73 GCRY01003761.1:288-1514(-)
MDELDSLLEDLKQTELEVSVSNENKESSLDELDVLLNDLNTGSANQAEPVVAVAPAPLIQPLEVPELVIPTLVLNNEAKEEEKTVPIASEPASAATDVEVKEEAPAVVTEKAEEKSSLSDLEMVQAILSGQDVSVDASAKDEDSENLDTVLSILNNPSGETVPLDDDADLPEGHCASCKELIVGQFITALGKTWHPNHFKCEICGKLLGAEVFYELNGRPYCEADYQASFCEKCALCGDLVTEHCVNAMGKMWHLECFRCTECGKVFPDGAFMEKDGEPFCNACFNLQFAPKCATCGEAITDECVSALGKSFHPEHFYCMDCKAPFDGAPFYDYDGQPYCEKHFHLKSGSLCANCEKPISGKCVSTLGKRFHPECFVCTFCVKPLGSNSFKSQKGQPYCLKCHKKLFA